MFYLNITCGLALISYEKSILKVMGVGLAVISFVQMLTAASNALGRLGYSMVSDYLKVPQHCLQDHFRILRSAVLGNLHV